MTHFKDSKGMVEKTGIGMGLMSAASAEAIISATHGAGNITGAAARSVFDDFNKDAALAYGVTAYLLLACSIWGLWDVIFGHASLSDQRMAIFAVVLLCVNALHAIALNVNKIGAQHKDLLKGYAPAWFGCTMFVAGGFYLAWLFYDISIMDISATAILIGGFILFNLLPKIAYAIVRDIRAQTVMIDIARYTIGIEVSPNNPDHTKRLENAWFKHKKDIGLKPLWMPTKIQFITIPLMIGMFLNG